MSQVLLLFESSFSHLETDRIRRFRSHQKYDTVQSSGSIEFSNYEQYSRQELPRVFRGALEAIVNEQAQPIEDGLRRRLVDMIQECQNHVFSTYRSRQSSHTISSPIPSFPPEIESLFSFEPPSTNREQNQNSTNSLDMLQNLYQEPPYQTQLQSTFVPDIGGDDFTEEAQRNSSSDSGYMSDILGIFDSGSNSMGFTTGTSFNSGSQHQEDIQASGNFTLEGETSNTKDGQMPWGMDESAWFSLAKQ